MKSIFIRYILTHHINSYSDIVSNIFITFEMVKYNQLFRKLKKDGWYIIRQKGSHVTMLHPKKKGQLTIPFHAGKEVKSGLLKAIVKKAGINFKQR